MNKFEVTSIRVKKLLKNESSTIVGTASIVINGSFLVNDIRIISTKNKMFCAMPSRMLEDKTFMDICHPLNQKTRQYIENLIISEFISLKEGESSDK